MDNLIKNLNYSAEETNDILALVATKASNIALQEVKQNVVNISEYIEEYEAKGMQCTGFNPESKLVEIVEIPQNRWFIGTQFHPEYQSTVLNPHPLFLSFIEEAIKG